jgi:hypothetical protein
MESGYLMSVRVILLIGPSGSGKSKWAGIFTVGGKWKWVGGDSWRECMRMELENGFDVVLDRSNCTEKQRLEFHQEIAIYNTGSLVPIDCDANVIVLVCHPSMGVGNKRWGELVGVQDALELPRSRGGVYRVLDLDNGATISWNEGALHAAANKVGIFASIFVIIAHMCRFCDYCRYRTGKDCLIWLRASRICRYLEE